MINIKSSNNKVNNSRNKISENNQAFQLSREEEEILYLINKCKFKDQISMTDLKLLNYNDYANLNKKNYLRDNNNLKLINQVELIYNRIYKQPQEKQRNKKLLHDMLFNRSESTEPSYLEKNNGSFNKIDKSHSSIKKKILPKLFNPDENLNKFKPNRVEQSRKELFLNNNINSDDSNDIKELYNRENNNSKDKIKKFYYIIKSNKNINENKRKNHLPPINKFRIKYNKFRLNVNNEINYSDQKHEDMMKMYKEIEFKNKNKFMV